MRTYIHANIQPPETYNQHFWGTNAVTYCKRFPSTRLKVIFWRSSATLDASHGPFGCTLTAVDVPSALRKLKDKHKHESPRHFYVNARFPAPSELVKSSLESKSGCPDH